MKRIYFLLFFFLLLISGINAQSKLTIDLSKRGVNISPTHYGIFFEDINHAADGGLYAELIRNRSFEDASTLDYWTTFNQSGTAVKAVIDSTNLLNSAQKRALKLTVASASALTRAGIYNSGFWGINVVNGRQYKLTFFAKCDSAFKGNISASLESASGIKYAEATVTGIAPGWQKFSCTLTASGNDTNARFVLSTNSSGTIWFDVVSLFPPTFNNRPNGLRPDLVQMLADLHPKFMRFPGGCFVEGNLLANRFQWKNTVGNIENRPGHINLWGYRTSDGMGFLEFLELSEDIGAIPLYVFNVGVAHGDFVPYNQIDSYIQDALDAIEYANGDITTTFGAKRAADGHPAPFNIQYVEVGNENSWGDHYPDRFYQFYNAFRAKYPNIKLIADGDGISTIDPSFKISNHADFIDEHYYSSPQWFAGQSSKYDSYSRTSSKVYVGEYAVTSNCGLGNLNAAIGEAAFMTGMEKNSDVVPMNSYAPIFVNMNDRTWNPDMINFNASTAYGTPSYYVQSMFANNIGDVVVPIQDSLVSKPNTITGSIGLGTWSTAADYSNVLVTGSNNNVLFSDTFLNSNNWTSGTGIWTVSNGIYSQTGTATDCRSVAANITDSVYTYTVQARKTSGAEGFLIIFGYKDSNNFYWWNIGGWGNTQTAIEQCVGGSKSILASVPGSVITNQWYNIKIQFTTSKVYFYLDNVLIHTLNIGSQFLFSSATLNSITKDLFVKVVNTSSNAINSTIDLHNLNKKTIDGSMTELTSTFVSDENSISNPLNVAPAVISVHSDSTVLHYLFKANSVNILKLNIDNNTQLISPQNPSESVDIYPSMTNGNVYIKSVSNDRFNISVLNIDGGQLLNQQVVGSQMIDLSHFSSGLYLFKIRIGNQLVVKKVLKY